MRLDLQDPRSVESYAKLSHRQRVTLYGDALKPPFRRVQRTVEDWWDTLYGGPLPPRARYNYGTAHKLLQGFMGELPNHELEQTWCVLQAMHGPHKAPLWILDEPCARALADTDPPFDLVTEELVEQRLRLPFPAMYLQVPPVSVIHDEQTGDHPIEGIYLLEDWCFPTGDPDKWSCIDLMESPPQMLEDPEQRAKAKNALEHDAGPEVWRRLRDQGIQFKPHADFDRLKRTILVVVMGKAKGILWSDAGHWFANDSFVVYRIGPGLRLHDEQVKLIQKAGDLTHLVINFLLALHTNHLSREQVNPKAPKSAAKERKRAARGEVFEPHTVVSLKKRGQGTGDRGQPDSRTEGGERAVMRGHIVRGHWRTYWVREPGDEVPLGDKEGKDGPLHRVARWIMPFERGDGPIASRTYEVKS